MLKSVYSAAIAIIAIASIVSCSSPPVFDMSTVNYVHSTFEPSDLKTEGLAVLPVVSGAGQEAYRRPMATNLSKYGAEAMLPASLVSWTDTMQRINDGELTEKYHKTISVYRETSILDKSMIGEIGRTVGARYLLFTTLQEFYSTQSSSGRTVSVGAFCQVWDSDDGNVVWEGNARAQVMVVDFMKVASYEQITQVAAAGLIEKLFQIEIEYSKLKSPVPRRLREIGVVN